MKIDHKNYYPFRCKHCGYTNSSQVLRVVHNWDDAECYCPICGKEYGYDFSGGRGFSDLKHPKLVYWICRVWSILTHPYRIVKAKIAWQKECREIDKFLQKMEMEERKAHPEDFNDDDLDWEIVE